MEEWKKTSVILGIGSWTDQFDAGVIMVLLPLLITAMNMGPSELALLTAIPTYIGLGVTIISGPLVDILGRKKMWVLGNAIAGLAYLIGALLASTYIDLIIMRVIGMIGMGFTLSIFFTWLPEVLPSEKRQSIMGYTSVLAYAAGLVMGLFVALSGSFPWITWQFVFVWTGVWDLVATVVGAVVLKESKLWLERKKLEKTEKTHSHLSYKGLFVKGKRLPFLIGLLIALTFSAAGLFSQIYSWNQMYMVKIMEFPTGLIGVLSMISVVVGAAIRVIVGRVSDKIGRLKTLLLFTAIAVPSTILQILTPVLIGVGPALIVVAFYFIFSQLGFSVSMGQEDTGKLILSESVPTLSRASAHSFLEFVKGVVLGSVAMLVGAVYGINPMLGMAVPMILGTVVGVSAVLVAIKLGYETKGKALE